jgi:hypothetical protein
MGDNARASWDWHNTEVGKGYQAKGVIRQPGSAPTMKVIDQSQPLSVDKKQLDSSKNEIVHKVKKTKAKKSKKSHKSSHSSSKLVKARFNPLVQLLATRLSNKTMSFS